MGSGLPSGTTGAISELLVSSDLLRRGYAVFRALSPSCSCDLAILKGGRLFRVEVRTAYRHQKTRRLFYPKVDPEKSDIAALVVGGTEIIYIPELEA
jgi:hypothetical protein